MSNARGNHGVDHGLEGLNPGLRRDTVPEVEDMTKVAGVIGQDGLSRGSRGGGRVRANVTKLDAAELDAQLDTYMKGE